MKLVTNSGAQRLIDLVKLWLEPGKRADLVSSCLSLFAYSEVMAEVSKLDRVQMLLPPTSSDLGLLGTSADRGARGALQMRWLAARCAQWLEEKVELRRATGAVPQGALIVRDLDGQPQHAVLGSFSLSRDGLGITPVMILGSQDDDMAQPRKIATAPGRVTGSNDDVALQVMVFRRIKHALGIKAASESTTQRTIVLRALKAFGFEVGKNEICDRRKAKP